LTLIHCITQRTSQKKLKPAWQTAFFLLVLLHHINISADHYVFAVA